MYEINRYEEALQAFQLAVNESRNVQSLTNLAWIYYHEESNSQLAEELLTEALLLKPQSYFPYNLLGEIYLERNEWQKAIDPLLKGIAITSTIEANYNLAVAYDHLGELELAAQSYLKGSKTTSDYASMSHISCLIRLGKKEEAKARLEKVDEEDDEFVGSVEVAEAYFELEDYITAELWYKKSWNEYYKQPNWIEGFIYTLVKNNKFDEAEQRMQLALEEKQAEIEDSKQDECNDDSWTESDKERNIQMLTSEFNQYQSLLERIESGYIPSMQFTTSLITRCYLFGCTRHQNSEYGR